LPPLLSGNPCHLELREMLLLAPAGQGWPGVADVLDAAARVTDLLRTSAVEPTFLSAQ
jgi:hypothetical protein